jgi:hypothetical protein
MSCLRAAFFYDNVTLGYLVMNNDVGLLLNNLDKI